MPPENPNNGSPRWNPAWLTACGPPANRMPPPLALAGAADRDVTRSSLASSGDFRRATPKASTLREDFTALREEMTERFSHVKNVLVAQL